MFALLLVLGFATAASPKPSPTPTPVPLKEIGVVNAMSPYCTTFYNHFNAAVRPMLAVDQQLNYESASLDNINELFTKMDWNLRFYEERLRIQKEVEIMERTTFQTQIEVNALRSGEKQTTDPERAHQIHMLAQEMQRALDKQKQLAIDLHGMLDTMMAYDTSAEADRGRPLSGFTAEDLKLPKDSRDVKAYLRFNGMRDRLHDAEGMAAGYATTIAQKYC